MIRFSKKRFFITLGLSVGVWLISVIYEAFSKAVQYVGTFTLSSCPATGYPLSNCISGIPVIVVFLINIFFWFWVIWLVWGFFGKKKAG